MIVRVTLAIMIAIAAGTLAGLVAYAWLDPHCVEVCEFDGLD